MSHEVPLFRWNPQRDRAAVLVAEDIMPDEVMATELGIDRRTLTRWRAVPEFAARVEHHRQLWRERIETTGVANRTNRVQAYTDRWHRLQQVIAERAADPEMQDVPGGTTGLLVHQTKAIGTGKSQTIIDEYAVDVATLKELRGLEKQAAEDLGQWSQRIDIRHMLEREAGRVAAERNLPKAEVLAELEVLLAERPA